MLYSHTLSYFNIKNTAYSANHQFNSSFILRLWFLDICITVLDLYWWAVRCSVESHFSCSACCSNSNRHRCNSICVYSSIDNASILEGPTHMSTLQFRMVQWNPTKYHAFTKGGLFLDQSWSTVVWMVRQFVIAIGNWTGRTWWRHGKVNLYNFFRWIFQVIVVFVNIFVQILGHAHVHYECAAENRYESRWSAACAWSTPWKSLLFRNIVWKSEFSPFLM